MSGGAETIAAPDTEDWRDNRAVGVSAWERFSFWCLRVVLRAHKAVWGARGLYASCKVFGTFEYLINYKHRRHVGKILDAVFGEELTPRRRRRLIRARFMRERCDKVFYLVFDSFSPEDIRRRFSITDRRLLDEGLARGKGVYLLMCHHGPTHVGGMMLSHAGFDVVVVRTPKEGALRRYMQDLWERRNPDLPKMKYLFSGDFARPIYRHFKDNAVLATALDAAWQLNPRLKTVAVEVFGQRRTFLTGTLQIAMRCDATVVQGFIIAEDDFRYRLELIGPLTDAESRDEDPQTMRSIMQRYADNIAVYARRYPDHINRLSGFLR